MLQVQTLTLDVTPFLTQQGPTTVSHCLSHPTHPLNPTLIPAFMSRPTRKQWNQELPTTYSEKRATRNIHGNFGARFCPSPSGGTPFVYGFSFINWKIADSIVCYLLPFWYESFFFVVWLPVELACHLACHLDGVPWLHIFCSQGYNKIGLLWFVLGLINIDGLEIASNFWQLIACLFLKGFHFNHLFAP